MWLSYQISAGNYVKCRQTCVRFLKSKYLRVQRFLDVEYDLSRGS